MKAIKEHTAKVVGSTFALCNMPDPLTLVILAWGLYSTLKGEAFERIESLKSRLR